MKWLRLELLRVLAYFLLPNELLHLMQFDVVRKGARGRKWTHISAFFLRSILYAAFATLIAQIVEPLDLRPFIAKFVPLVSRHSTLVLRGITFSSIFAVLLSLDLVVNYLLLPFLLLVFVENPVFFHSDGEAFGESAALAESPRLHVDVAVGSEETFRRRRPERVSPEERLARLARNGVEIVAQRIVVTNGTPLLGRRVHRRAGRACLKGGGSLEV